MRIGLFVLAIAASLALAGCSSSGDKKEASLVATNEKAPDVFQVEFDTSKGKIVVEVHRDWAPNGVDHFYTLVKTGFYENARFYRTIRGFVAQFGISGDPKKDRTWHSANIPDDPVKQGNAPGTLVYAQTQMPNSRSTEMFFNLRDNSANLDRLNFAAIGKVITGMDVAESLYSGYGDGPASGGEGPDPGKIESQGNAYLESQFPRLDFIKKISIQ